jgi:hypothetical protein
VNLFEEELLDVSLMPQSDYSVEVEEMDYLLITVGLKHYVVRL